MKQSLFLLVTAGIGPLARDVDSLAFCMKALLCEDLFRLDPTVPPIPFNDEVKCGCLFSPI